MRQSQGSFPLPFPGHFHCTTAGNPHQMQEATVNGLSRYSAITAFGVNQAGEDEEASAPVRRRSTSTQ
eukprot:1153297-Pelagomonas_calceolata.AAC.9